MKLKIKKDFLVSHLEAFKNIIHPKPTLTILTNILIKCDANGIEIRGTDTNISGIKKIKPCDDFELDGEDTLLINYFNLRDIATKVVGDIIEIKSTDDSVSLHSGRSKYKLNRMDISQFTFPTIPTSTVDCTVPRNEYVKLINKTSFAVDGKESRIPLQGICTNIAPDKLSMYGTDGKKIAAVYYNNATASEPLEILIHVDYMKKIAAIISLFQTEEITIKKGGNTAIYQIGDEMTICASTIAAKAPNYESILSKPVECYKATVNKDEFVGMLKRTMIVSNNKEMGVSLTFEENNLTAVVKSEQGSCEESMPIEFVGDKYTMNLSIPYLLQAFGVYDYDTANIVINHKTNQFSVIRDDLTYLIAARRIPSSSN